MSEIEDFSVVVPSSDLRRPLLSQSEQQGQVTAEAAEWGDRKDDDFSDLEALQTFRLQGSDRAGNRILRIVGKYFPAAIITAERLKWYVFHKLSIELPEGPFSILYIHTSVNSEDNNPGMSILRWVYEGMPSDYKNRLQVVYFLHPALRARLAIATLGRLFLSGGVYWKIKYVNRLQYLWDDVKKGQAEIPEFVKEHDEILEHRPLTDYGIEPDPLSLCAVTSMTYAFGRFEDKWAASSRK